jgi:bacterioferritin-associated ferredoxin
MTGVRAARRPHSRATQSPGVLNAEKLGRLSNESRFQLDLITVIMNNSVMYVCVCFAVTDATIDAVIAGGAGTIDAVTRACRAGGDCGACRGEIADRLAEADGRVHLPCFAERRESHAEGRSTHIAA